MILDRLFVNLRQGRPGIFLASKVLDFYGRCFIGGPKPEDFPDSVPLKMREHLAKTYFYMPVDRWIRKHSKHSGLGQLWSTQLRQEEEPQAGKAAFIYPVLLCTLLVALGGFVHKSSTGIESWWKQREAKAAAKDAAEYQAKRADLQKKWATEIASYSAQQCMDEALALRVRDTDEKRDRYNAIEQGCSDKVSAIQEIGKAWTIEQCADFGKRSVKELRDNKGQQTWADFAVFQNGCASVHDHQALSALLNK